MNKHSSIENLIVLYEDNHIIIVNKRPGDIIQGDQTKDTPLSEIVKQYIAVKYQKKGNVFLGVVHRLDRPTSGIVVFARTSKALTRLNQMWAEKKVEKTYWAMVQPKPEKTEGQLIHWLKRNSKQNKSYAHSKEVKDSKKAILYYETIKNLDHYSLLEIKLETGRHHQIRSQLAYMKCYIKGDLKYGAKRSNPNGGIHLHSRGLKFKHPVKKIDIDIKAPIPYEDACWKMI